MDADTKGPKEEGANIRAPLFFTAISAVVFILLGVLGVIFLNRGGGLFPSAREADFEKFRSEQEMRDYLSQVSQTTGFDEVARDSVVPFGAPEALSVTPEEAARVSTTNVQVYGLDEPDIVKTDGRSIFASTQNFRTLERALPVEPFVGEDRIMPPYEEPSIKVVSALPHREINLASELDASGDMLVYEDRLMVFEYNKVRGFDISNPASPYEAWSYSLDENFNYATARLKDGKVYLVTARHADYSLPCPVPFLRGASELTIACTDIYHPDISVPVDTMYSIVKLDAMTGRVEDSLSFLGDSDSGVVYMSPNAIYMTFTSYPSPLQFMANFMAENRSVLGDEVVEKVNNLRNIDISNESKINELRIIFARFLSTLSNDEKQRVTAELENKMDDYLKIHGRELQVSNIIKADAASLDIVAQGEVPGAPLNQFSLDEYGGNLRIATTLSVSTIFGRGESANDIYVLDEALTTLGQIQGLALGERIFSARFIDERGYLVTFKQIDPFFVIDLSDPANPRVSGELKIPGFSSYLHPLSTNLILGVGQEEGQVKLSVFDVQTPENPVEVSKYMLPDFYSEVQSNHHAFLADQEKQVFFLPAGDTGYIFDWEGGLTLERTVTGIRARRAVYINNFLYIVGDSEVVVLNEDNWEEVSRLAL